MIAISAGLVVFGGWSPRSTHRRCSFSAAASPCSSGMGSWRSGRPSARSARRFCAARRPARDRSRDPAGHRWDRLHRAVRGVARRGQPVHHAVLRADHAGDPGVAAVDVDRRGGVSRRVWIAVRDRPGRSPRRALCRPPARHVAGVRGLGRGHHLLRPPHRHRHRPAAGRALRAARGGAARSPAGADRKPGRRRRPRARDAAGHPERPGRRARVDGRRRARRGGGVDA